MLSRSSEPSLPGRIRVLNALRMVSNMVVKLTRQQKKITLHDSYDAAYDSVLQTIETYTQHNLTSPH